MALANQRTVYLNGEFVPESEALIPIKDAGFKFGDAAFDTTRTFGHRIFRLREHLERFERSLRYLGLSSGHSLDRFVEITGEVVRRNLPLIGDDEDYWVSQRVSRGVPPGDREAWPDWPDATVVVECTPLPLAARASFYRDGIDVVTPGVRRVAPDMISPRAKSHNYLNLILGDLEVAAQDPNALSVLLDRDGNLAEGGQGQQHLPALRRATEDTARTDGAAGREPGGHDGTRCRPRHTGGRDRYRPVRRLQRRGGLHHLDQFLHLPDPQHQRAPAGQRGGPGPGHPAADEGDRRLRRSRRLRLVRAPVPETLLS